MKSFQLVFTALFIFCSIHYTDAQNIQGSFPSLYNQKVKFGVFDGLQSKTIDSILVGANGSFSFRFSIDKPGIGFLVTEENKPYFLILDKVELNAFKSLSLQFGNTFEEIFTDACSINSRGSVSFTHYTVAGKNVFFIPHLIGNLHIAKEKKEDFEIFKSSLIAYIHSTIS